MTKMKRKKIQGTAVNIDGERFDSITKAVEKIWGNFISYKRPQGKKGVRYVFKVKNAIDENGDSVKKLKPVPTRTKLSLLGEWCKQEDRKLMVKRAGRWLEVR